MLSDILRGGFDPLLYLARVLAFATAIPFHEAAHALVSDKLGDSTAKEMGRLSLNPLRHLDLWGFLAMLFIGVGWAKPVPVHTECFRNRRLGMALTAVAGPVSNLLLAYVCLLAGRVFQWVVVLWAVGAGAAFPAWAGVVGQVLLYLAVININLAVFNMLPIPPFDGSRVFGLVLPEKAYFAVMKYERYIMFGVLALLWLGVLNVPLQFLNKWALAGLSWATGYVDLIFGAFLP